MAFSNKPAFYSIVMPVAGDRPVFEKVEVASAVVETLQSLRVAGIINLYAFTVLPDHLKLLVAPKGGNIVKTMLYELRLQIGRAVSAKGFKGTLWTPKSEILKVFEPSAARKLAREIEGAPVDAGIVEDPRAYAFSSAHPDHSLDSIPEEVAAPAMTIVPIPAAA